MRSAKVLTVFLILSAIMFYFGGCSSAEQTTAKLAYAQGDYKKAEEEFLKETNQNPANEEAWYYLTLSRLKQKKNDEAKTSMDSYRKIGLNTFKSEIVNEWATIFDEGVKSFENGEGYYAKKDNKEAIKLYNSAIVSFKSALVLLPDSTIAQSNINAINGKIAMITVNPVIIEGAALLDQNKYEEAIAKFNEAKNMGLEKDSPGYETVLINLGIAYTKWGGKLLSENSENDAYKEKFQTALPLLEEIMNTKNKENKITVYELLVPVYANLGMSDKAQDAIKMRDQLKNENK